MTVCCLQLKSGFFGKGGGMDEDAVRIFGILAGTLCWGNHHSPAEVNQFKNKFDRWCHLYLDGTGWRPIIVHGVHARYLLRKEIDG